MNFFVAPPSQVLSWLNRKGYYGTVYDAFIDYVSDGSSLSYGTIYDHLNNRLQSSGYSGDLDDMLNTMFMQKTGEFYRYDAERKFFDDSSLDMFSVSSDLLAEDGSILLAEDGTPLKSE